MPTYKLTYFNVTGLGEPLRFLLHYGGVDFEDKRISREEWPEYKHQMPMEQIPILEIDGQIYHQNRAIARYLAKKFGIHSSDDLEALRMDASVDDIEDLRQHVTKFFREDNPELKAKLQATANERAPFCLKKFEEQVKKNGGFFFANKLSWVDIYFTAIIEMISKFMQKEYLADYPKLKNVYETVRSHPNIKAYLDKRPVTSI